MSDPNFQTPEQPPQGFGGAPQGVPQGVPPGMPQGAPQGMPQSAPQDFQEFTEQVVEGASADRVINTASGKRDGLDKCRRCGATEIVYSVPAKALACSYCRYTWNEPNANETYGFDDDSSKLVGVIRGSGADDIDANASNTTTIKCQGCGAEIVVETNHAVGARCHWCRQQLTINNQIPNGLIPDALVPFMITHEQAVEHVRKFANDRRYFTTKEFKTGFQPENLVGVYLPYVAADVRADAHLVGVGEIETRRYTVTVGSGDDSREETRYDADEYGVDTTLEYTADDLFAESSATRTDMTQSTATHNVINAILPFDLSQAVVYSSHYLTGFTSERRDLDVEDVSPKIQEYLLSLARSSVQKDPRIRKMDRGVRWTEEGVRVEGIRWQTLYLPVWLYAFPAKRTGKDDFVHFIAVNGQNGRTMGSIPLNHVKATGMSLGVAAIAFVVSLILGMVMGE